jgi:uncharacterized protein
MEPNASLTVRLMGEPMVLHPAKVAWWPRRATLFLADTHFGKAATFRQAGLPVPTGTTAALLSRLTAVIAEFNPERLIVLGDLVHASTRTILDFETELLDWRAAHDTLELILIRGNHDRGHAKLFAEMRLHVVTEPYYDEMFAYCHQPDLPIDENHFFLAGHLHPGILVNDSGSHSVKLPCFQLCRTGLILPGFGEFTGLCCDRPPDHQRSFVIVDDTVQSL